MNAKLRSALALAAVAISTQAVAQVTFYERENFQGRSFTADREIENFGRFGFNDRAESVVVLSDRWEVCEDVRFGGRCVLLRPGRYPSLTSMGLNDRVSSVRIASGNAPPPVAVNQPVAAAQITFYEREGFRGQSFTADREIQNLGRFGFNDRAESVVVLAGGWEVCENIQFGGRCAVLRPGRYPSLTSMGLNDRVSSVRAVSRNARIEDNRYAPPPVAVNDYSRRNDERLYQVNVTSVHAVVGPPEQRCWVEHQQVAQDRGNANVGGAIAGAILGGILGHQVGNGRGQDLATAGGAVAGAAVGANVGRTGSGQQVQDVQRCESTPSQAQPSYWDVTYSFRGQEHRVQMTAPPGPTVTVNDQGEPRG